MATHTIKGFIVCERSPYSAGLRFDFMTLKPSPSIWPDRTIVAEHQFDIEVSDNYNPVADLVANLEEVKRAERVKLANKLAAIDEQIAKLTSLEYTAPSSGAGAPADEIPF